MRIGAITLSVVIGLALAATALAAPAAKNPGSLILRKADFPAGADYDAQPFDQSGVRDSIAARGVETKAASYLGATYSKSKGFLQVTGVVYTTGSLPKAKKAFAAATTGRAAFWKRFPTKFKPITLPSFGTQQSALYQAAGPEGIWLVDVLVRKNTVIWWLLVKVERRPAAPLSEVLAQVIRYASKQKARVGAG